MDRPTEKASNGAGTSAVWTANKICHNFPLAIVAGTAGVFRRYRFATALQKESARSGVQDPILTSRRW